MDKPTVSSVQKHMERLISKSEHLIDTGGEVPDSLPAIVQWLRYMQQLLAQGRFNKEDLARQSFGIFRVVSDDVCFEESDLGKELLELGGELRELE